MTNIKVFDSPNHMEPLLPSASRGRLGELSKELMVKIGRLIGCVHSPAVRKEIGFLIREMNCYYSNLIEGHKTIPRDIERALREDYSNDPVKRDNQLLSNAHIQVETQMHEKLHSEDVDVYSQDFICWLHGEFYNLLPEELRVAKHKDGKSFTIQPGEYRNYMVDIGRHTPPHFEKLKEFMERFCEFYGSPRIFETNRLVAIAASHQRLAWIHPFGDGNGRVMRLYSHALMVHHGLDGDSLWTLSRGLARRKSKYYQTLEVADQTRSSDYDGRGNLTDRGLAEFCIFFLETMLDQVEFMGSKLELPGLRQRVEKYFQFEMEHLGIYSEPLMKVVRVLVDEGEFPRSKVQDITGRSEAYCTDLIKKGLHEGLIKTPSPKGVLQITFPAKTLDSYFPRLFQDL